MRITRKEIEDYLCEVKKAIKQNRYRFELNSNREENIILFTKYNIDFEKAKNILLNLKVDDFSERYYNKNDGYEQELLYVFGKNVELEERHNIVNVKIHKIVLLYIKFNMLENCYVIVVSLHEQKYPIKYYFI